MPVTRYIYENIISTPLTKLLTARELTIEDTKKIEYSNWEAIHKSFI
jgi:hypothetical protein